MRSGDWLKEMYDANYAALYRLAAYRLRVHGGNESDAPEVVQDVFLLAAKKKIINHPNPKGWLNTVTENICKNYARKDRRNTAKQRRCAEETLNKNVHSTLLFVEPSGRPMDESDARMTMEQALPPEDWKLLQDYCLEGKPIEVLAAQMHVSENALRVRIHRLRKKIEKYFQ